MKYFILMYKHFQCEQREAGKEEDTYGKVIELKQVANVIPSKRSLNGEETIIVFDLVTTAVSFFTR